MYTPSTTYAFSPSDYTPSLVFNFTDDTPAIVIASLNATLEGASGAVAIRVTTNKATLAVTLDGASGLFIVNNPVAVFPVVFDFVVEDYTPSLIFAFTDGTPETVIASINVTLDGASGAFTAEAINNKVTMAVTLDDAGGVAVCHYDINVKRVLSSQVNAIVQDAKAIGTKTLALINQSDFAISQTNSNNQNAIDIQQSLCSLVGQTVTLNHKVLALNTNAITITNTVTSLIRLTQFIDKKLCVGNTDATLQYSTWQSIQDVLKFIITQTSAALDSTSYRHYLLLKPVYRGNDNYEPTLSFTFDSLSPYLPDGVFEFGTVTISELVEAAIAGVLSVNNSATINQSVQILRKLCSKLEQAKSPAYGKSPHIDPPRPPPPEQPPSHATLTIPTKEAYSMHHSISVVALPDNTPVPLSKISLSYDVDSYCWVFSGTLADKASLPDVTMTDDVPVQLSITINGYQWIVLVEKIPETKSFGKTSITLNGRSLSAQLGSPYQLPASYTAGSDMTVQQIADSLLPIGWTIDWQCATPWVIPANTYSHTQQTPLQALATIAQNIGAVLVPHRYQQVLIMQPRYPILPWDYHATGINPDLVIPDSAIESIGLESRTQSPINAVYVHGEQNGVLAWCRLNGTAGDVLAPTQTNALITDVTGARALSERILAGAATQPLTTSMTTWLGGDFPLANIGWLVEVNSERAIVNGISVNVEFGKVRQTLTFGEQTNNAYSKLLYLLPSQPLLVGKCVASYDDKSILTLLDGGVITARGTGIADISYYVRNGLIESVAPDLVLSEIVI